MFGELETGTRHIGFLLIPDFSMIAFSSAVEPLRLANRVANGNMYRGTLFSLDGGPVTASNGVTVQVDTSLMDAPKLDTIMVCSGVDVAAKFDKALAGQLRRMASHGVELGAICTASHLFAKAGLLDGYRCTIHWENLGAFIEEFPDIEVTSELFEIDRKRMTCAGGTAALDLSLNLIAYHGGYSVAAAVADQLIHHRIREGQERQRMELRSRLGVAHPKLISAIEKMEESLEEPLNCASLAREVGISTRQLERLFRKYLGAAPTRYYLELRLQRARYLLQQTALPILSVALACGFVSASHFSKCYREYYGHRPSEERRRPLADQLAQAPEPGPEPAVADGAGPTDLSSFG